MRNIFVRANQQAFGTCFYDMELPAEAEGDITPLGVSIVHPDAPVAAQNEMFEHLFDSMVIKDNQYDPRTGKVVIADVKGKVKAVVDKMFEYQWKYQKVSGKYSVLLRWYDVALLYKLESDEPLIGANPKFNRYLGNGQPLNKRTTIVPVGRGPFSSWEAGCWDAIELQRLHRIQDWSNGNRLRLLESFNGDGYRRYRNMQSAYLFSGSNHYESGKYASDGKFDPGAVSSQIGLALYLKEILNRLA